MSLVCIARGSLCFVFFPQRFPQLHLAGVRLGFEASKREGGTGGARGRREGHTEPVEAVKESNLFLRCPLPTIPCLSFFRFLCLVVLPCSLASSCFLPSYDLQFEACSRLCSPSSFSRRNDSLDKQRYKGNIESGHVFNSVLCTLVRMEMGKRGGGRGAHEK